VGSWALVVFGLFSLLSFMEALAEDDETRRRWRILGRSGVPWQALRRLRSRSLIGRIAALLGGIAGFYFASYTGVLLAVTNRPIWSDTPLLGMLFVVSAASTSAALLVLLAHRFGWNMKAVRDLYRMDVWVVALELVVLVAVIVSLGPVLRPWLNAWGLLLVLGVIVPGVIVPLWAAWRRDRFRLRQTGVAVLVLIGGFILRLVVVMSSEAM
jgi:formate-dependent nitrite reductase membrane component NrfD